MQREESGRQMRAQIMALIIKISPVFFLFCLEQIKTEAKLTNTGAEGLAEWFDECKHNVNHKLQPSKKCLDGVLPFSRDPETWLIYTVSRST